MKKTFLIGIFVITVTSTIVTFYAPINEIYRGIASLPAVAALSAALFQLLRDNASHQRSLQLQQEQQLFNLGATSHMANTVFDKHVEFSEKYLAEVHELVVTLTKEGPTQLALDHAGKLYSLRIAYTAWITPEIDKKLFPFEQAVREIGAKSWLIKALSGAEGKNEERKKAVNEMFDTFSSVMDISEREVKDEDATVVEVKNRVREILQVNELISIREYLIHRASSTSANKTQESI